MITQKLEQIQFEGIDSFNRPVFKSLCLRNRFGSVDKLFSLSATEQEVLKTVAETDLCFFGTSFGCEPMGTSADGIKIVPTN